MNSNRKKQTGLLLIVIVIAGLLAFATGAGVAQADAQIVPPDGTWEGKTYGEWGVEWWQWALAMRANATHPLIDDYKVDCNLGQDGDVWFFGGTFAAGPDPDNPTSILGQADRICRKPIPAGKALFFPVNNIICSNLSGDGSTEEELSGCANYVVDSYVYPLSATIDGETLDAEDLENFRTVSGLFEIEPMPYKNLLGHPKDTEGIGVTSGYYLLLPPLPEGEHEIAFEAETLVPDYDGDGIPEYHFVLDISYSFTVADDD